MTDEEYFSIDAVSQSALKYIADEKFREYEAIYVTKTRPGIEATRSMELGTAIHGTVCMGKPLADCLRVIPASCLKSNGAINPKPTDEFRGSLPEGCTACKEEEYHASVRAVDKLLKKLGPILDHEYTQRELAVFWTNETSLACKAKFDIVLPRSDGVLVIDLKATVDASPTAFWRTAKNLRYWLQESQYREGAEAHFGMPADFAFLAVEKAPDSLGQCGEHRHKPSVRAEADDARRRYMERLARCYATGDFSDEWEEKVNWLDYPKYTFLERDE